MSFKTIRCRLVAKESTRQQLWELMVHKNTPLINELLLQVAQHSDFETWRKKGKAGKGIITQLCQSLKSDPALHRSTRSVLHKCNYTCRLHL